MYEIAIGLGYSGAGILVFVLHLTIADLLGINYYDQLGQVVEPIPLPESVREMAPAMLALMLDVVLWPLALLICLYQVARHHHRISQSDV